MCVCVCVNGWMDGCVCEWVCGCMCLCVYVLLAGHPLPLRLTLRRSLLNIDSLTLHSILRLLLLAAQMQLSYTHNNYCYCQPYYFHWLYFYCYSHHRDADITETLLQLLLMLLQTDCGYCCWFRISTDYSVYKCW